MISFAGSIVATATVLAFAYASPAHARNVDGSQTIVSQRVTAHALVGNNCGREVNGTVSCDQAFYGGHPADGVLPLRANGTVEVPVTGDARRVTMRLAERVTRGGGLEGPIGSDLTGTRAEGSNLWSVVLPASLERVGAISVEIVMPDETIKTYYIRASPAVTSVAVRYEGARYLPRSHQTVRVSVRSAHGKLMMRHRLTRRLPMSVFRTMPGGRYSVLVRPSCKSCRTRRPGCRAALRLPPSSTSVIVVKLRALGPCAIRLRRTT